MTGIRVLPLLLALTLTLGACGDDGPTGNNGVNCAVLGTFNGNVAGAVTTAMIGCAAFGVELGTTEFPTTFVLGLSHGGLIEPTHFVLLEREGTRPGTGAYTVGTETGQLSGFIAIGGGTEDRFFEFTSGTVTFTTSTASAVNGSVNLTATEFEGTAVITLTGTFAAKCDPSEFTC